MKWSFSYNFFVKLIFITRFTYNAVSLIAAGSHTFADIDHEIIPTVILFPSADLFKKGCCQLQAKVSAQSTG